MRKFRQISVVLTMMIIVFLSSCKKESLSPSSSSNSSNSTETFDMKRSFNCGTPTISDLLAGQNTNVGSVTVYNDLTDLYVAYKTTENWYINELHLYVGDLSGVPLTKTGNPSPGKFPHTISFPSNIKVYTFKIPLSSLNNCFIVAAHATLTQRNSDCSVISTETAWGKGHRFSITGNWGTYFDVCKKNCEESTADEGCSMSQGYWFASPVSVWPSSGVTVAGYNYSKAEALAIWNSSNAGGIRHSKKGFLQVATIYLSGSTVLSSASVWDEVNTVESWLSSLGKLSTTNLPTGNQVAGSSAGNIGTWIDAHHCQ